MKTTSLFVLGTILTVPFIHAQTQYSHGNPTGDEQYMLELINRARANPTAEGQRLASSNDPNVQLGISFFGVDKDKLRRDFASYPVKPPLAMNAKLLTAARRHSSDMAKKNFQSHTGSDGSTIGSRIADAGFKSSFISENIYSNLVPTPFLAHAGFAIDWGNGPGGLQPGLGHRTNIMALGNASYREVGIGISSRSGADASKYGKLAVAQDYGTQTSSPFFLLGVAYQDNNSNGICDPGEGLSGIKVQPSVGSFFAVTSTSGGYAIPFENAPGAASVVFSGGSLSAPVTRTVTLERENVKLDLKTVSSTITLKMEALDKTAGERKSGGTARFRISRTGPTGELKVTVKRPTAKKKGTAQPSDYQITAVKPAKVSGVGNRNETFVVTIPRGENKAEVKITAIKDKNDEPTEKVKFSLVKAPAYKIATPDSVTISIKE